MKDIGNAKPHNGMWDKKVVDLEHRRGIEIDTADVRFVIKYVSETKIVVNAYTRKNNKWKLIPNAFIDLEKVLSERKTKKMNYKMIQSYQRYDLENDYQSYDLEQEHGKGIEIRIDGDKVRVVMEYLSETEITINVYIRKNNKWKPIEEKTASAFIDLEEVLSEKLNFLDKVIS